MSQLRDQFYKECGCTWINGDGEPDIDYVKWLEAKVEKLTPTIEQCGTDAQQLKPTILTREQMWGHLKTIPTPSADVLLSGGMMMYYVDACYDYMCQHFGH